MSDRSDVWIASLVLGAVGFVLAAPVLGRSGHSSAAGIALAFAAGSALGAFLLAGHATWQATRSPSRSRHDAEDPR